MKGEKTKKARERLDARLSSLGPPEDYVPPHRGWIRAIRDALGMSATDLGQRMGVSHAAVSEMEGSERNGKVRLDTLGRAAEAMNCTLVYALIPRGSLESIVRSRAEEIVDGELRRVQHTMALEGQREPVSENDREDAIRRALESRRLWSDPR